MLYKLRRHGIRADTKSRTIFIPCLDNAFAFPQVRRLAEEYHFNIQYIIT